MGKLVALILVCAVVVTAIPSMAATKAGGTHEKTLFQRISDSVDDAYNAREKKPWKTVTIFEEIRANIDSLDDTIDKVKELSLRENREELARRRNIR